MQDKEPLEKTPMSKTEEALAAECAARVREKVRQSVKDDAVNLAAMALLVVALASCVHPTDWAAFCHVLQFVCVIGAVALLFWNNFHQLVEFLNETRGGRRREYLFSIAGALLLMAGYGLMLLGAYSPVDWLKQGCQIVGLALIAVAILAFVVVLIVLARTTWRMFRIYRRVRATDDEAELQALSDEIERLNKES